MDEVLGRDAFLAGLERPEVKTKDVPIPELGGKVRVREWTGQVRNRIEAAHVAIQSGGKPKVLDDATAFLLSVCVLDANDRPMLTLMRAAAMLEKSPRIAFRLRDEIMELSATSDEDVEALAEVFGGPQSDSGISA